MIAEWLTRWLSLGLGLASLTREKADELAQELVRRGQMSREEAREMVDRLLKQADQQREEMRRAVQQQLQRVMETAGVARREELEALRARVAELERRLGVTPPADSPGDGEGVPPAGGGTPPEGEQAPGASEG